MFMSCPAVLTSGRREGGGNGALSSEGVASVMSLPLRRAAAAANAKYNVARSPRSCG